MAEAYETGDQTVIDANPIHDLLEAPLGADWTIEGLAEQLLGTIATDPGEQQFLLDATANSNRQSHRLLRPLLACLANMSAAESGTADDVFGGDLLFKRAGTNGPVWIIGQFENTQRQVRAVFQRSSSPPKATVAQAIAENSIAALAKHHNR